MRKLAAFFLIFSLSMFAEPPPPSAKDILASVRMAETQQQIDLQGQLRENDVIIPFRLTQNGPLIRYSFTNPDEVLQLRLGENSSRLDLVTETGTERFAASKLHQKIRGTTLTYTLLWAALAWVAWLWTAAAGTMISRYVALGLTGCAAVAVLGARRPVPRDRRGP